MEPVQRVISFHALNVLGVFINCSASVELIGFDGDVCVQKCCVFDVVDTVNPGKRVRWPTTLIEGVIARKIQEDTRIEDFEELPEIFTEAF